MLDKAKIHIVSFDVPYPPVYGGIIDVFYKLKALSEAKVEITLHLFENGSGDHQELEAYCHRVYYYKRNTSFLNFLSGLPYIVKSRQQNSLIANLNSDRHPILFEGLHTTAPLLQYDFGQRLLLLRAHNIEHSYYSGLSNSEPNIWKKLFFKIEANKLKRYESLLNKFDHILAIAPFEHRYFNLNYANKSSFIPPFHSNVEVAKLEPKGNYALYHGDLRVSDNVKAASHLIEVFRHTHHPLVIAGSNCKPSLVKTINTLDNISYIELNAQAQLDELLKNAHINFLISFQKTGIKLKLINSLYKSRFCLVNSEMVEDTGLESLCTQIDLNSEVLKTIDHLFSMPYTTEDVKKRKLVLSEFSTIQSVRKIIDLMS